MFEVTLEIPPSVVEPGYNHVNHAQILTFMEKARLSYLEHIGLPNETLLSRGLFLVIAKILIEYKREIFSGCYTITVEHSRFEGKSLLMDQRVLNDRKKECINSTFDFRLIDKTLRRSIAMPEELVTAVRYFNEKSHQVQQI